MLWIPIDLALTFTRQLIAAKLGHEPTGPPITLDQIRAQVGGKTNLSDRELTRQLLNTAFNRIKED